MENYDLIDLIKNKYLSNNKEDVLNHVKNVADTAIKLAKSYNLDFEKIKLAALLHDISTIMSPQEMYDFAKKRGMEIDSAEEKYHSLLHQRVSKIIANEEFSITDSDILNAIECHTTLKKNANMYDKVIFIADKISWDKNICDLLKKKADKTLDEACFFYIKYQFDNNLLVMPHQWLIDAYEDLKQYN
ncbi:MAG: bis(5'-nucleosyl)-tetraphosphatase (symmetrical) YqeK [Clostridia bacterium]|nr:bis(5'-nucleosyl)-tetraphosphatase (symmetrical) YqeK [Clostridia bacterium]